MALHAARIRPRSLGLIRWRRLATHAGQSLRDGQHALAKLTQRGSITCAFFTRGMNPHGQLIDLLGYVALLLRGHGNLLRPLHDVIKAGNRIAQRAGHTVGLLHRILGALGA